MNFHHPLAITPLAALFMGCFFIGLQSCENSEKDIKALTSRRIGVEQARGVSINYTLGGKIKTKITAPEMMRHQDSIPFTEFPASIHGDFYNDQSIIETKLDAKYGRYIESQSNVFLKDSVRVFNTSGDTLYSSELYWDRSHIGKEFHTDKAVSIRGKQNTRNGIGFEASENLHNWVIFHPTGISTIPASQFPQ